MTAVVDYLKEAILNGRHPPGSELPEIPPAKAVSTSRTTVREALRVLQDMSLVVMHPRRGASVASMSPKLVREIVSLRAVLEAFAVRLAITEGRIGRADLADIEAAFEHLRLTSDKGVSFATIEADMAFHRSFRALSEREVLLEQLRSLDPDRAEAVVKTHITSVGERLPVRLLEHAGEHRLTEGPARDSARASPSIRMRTAPCRALDVSVLAALPPAIITVIRSCP